MGTRESSFETDELELSPAVFSILSALIEEKVGLHYGLLDREILQQKASSRVLEAGFSSFLDYYYYLRYDENSAAELKELTDALVVNETYFFREWPAIEILVKTIVAQRAASGDKVRIWSAACSTGEEPLSLAMLLDHSKLLDHVDITATDISTRVLARAQSGQFSKRSVRHVPCPHLAERYLSATPHGYQIDRKLIEAVHWERRNLLQPVPATEVGRYDIILCRNVLIYFADSTIRQVLEGLGNALKPDGALFIGVSESLLRFGSRFFGEERGGAFVYRKSV